MAVLAALINEASRADVAGEGDRDSVAYFRGVHPAIDRAFDGLVALVDAVILGDHAAAAVASKEAYNAGQTLRNRVPDIMAERTKVSSK